MAFNIDTDTNDETSILVTNGITYVSVITKAPNERGFMESKFVGLHPNHATDLAVALLNAAANVRAYRHGNGNAANYTDVQRAREALNYDGLPTESGLYEDDNGTVFWLRDSGLWFPLSSDEPFANWEVSLLAVGELHRLGRV